MTALVGDCVLWQHCSATKEQFFSGRLLSFGASASFLLTAWPKSTALCDENFGDATQLPSAAGKGRLMSAVFQTDDNGDS